MNPDAYYKYSDFGTIENRRPKEEPPAPSEPEMMDAEDGAMPSSVVYNLDLLSSKRPGPVLAVGFGIPLKALVRAANAAEVQPLYTTSTDDKFRAFSFGGTSKTVSLGKKFDARLFNNAYAVLNAAENCGARSILCASNVTPSDVLSEECYRRDILLMVPVEGDKSLTIWRKAASPAVLEAMAESGSAPSERIAPAKWRRCARCGLTHDERQVISNNYKCPSCGKLMRLSSDERIAMTFDEGSVQEWDTDVPETNPIDFPDFDGVIKRARERSGYKEGVRTGRAAIEGLPLAFGIMEPSFIMGSMGHVVGEKLARMFERAKAERLPVVVFAASGGARMQEGLSSLMQMAKVSAAVEAHGNAGLLYISVLTDPTTGGVTASFATLGDIIFAEPEAIIGFAGRRVIQDTIKQALPDDFQTAEFAMEHGLVDAIVCRNEMRSAIAQILRLHEVQSQEVEAQAPKPVDRENPDAALQTAAVEEPIAPAEDETFADDVLEGIDEPAAPRTIASIVNGLSELAGTFGHALTDQADKATLWWTLRNKGVADAPYIKPSQDVVSEGENRAWESVKLARNVHRPTSLYYISSLFDDFIELHGDRAFADDGAIVAGIGRIDGRSVTVIAEEKGQDLKAKIARNFGCPQPEGYRKAMRLMRQAEKFGRPVVCFVDTQGAFCGKEAEERGMGNAIAESLALMSGLTVPVVSVVLGEGGSGGALALAVANKVAMQENAVYSVLSPEGFASILWKDGSRAPEAASVMKMSAQDALSIGMIEDIIPEGQAPAHENPDQAAAAVWLYVTNALDELAKLTPEELKQQRYERFRKF